MGIVLEKINSAVEGAASIGSAGEYADEALLELQRDFPEVHLDSTAGRKFHFECVAEVKAEFLE